MATMAQKPRKPKLAVNIKSKESCLYKNLRSWNPGILGATIRKAEWSVDLRSSSSLGAPKSVLRPMDSVDSVTDSVDWRFWMLCSNGGGSICVTQVHVAMARKKQGKA